jgi:FAD:protein FMN transferase
MTVSERRHARDVSLHSVALMGTVVTIQTIRDGTGAAQAGQQDVVERACAWFRRVEECCSRFDDQSELRRLCRHVGEPVPVSAMLYEAIAFALAVAGATGGEFDPTVGAELEARGFNREYRSGDRVRPLVSRGLARDASYRDVTLDPSARTVTLLRPLVLDLGAVAKGLAIDMAARELQVLGDYGIDAGGDLYLAGRNVDGQPWTVGVRHPRTDGLLLTLRVSDLAVCTSGDYERRNPHAGHHIVDPRDGSSAASAASVTVVAPTAMVADALATAAFVLGSEDGIRLLERQGVDGLIVTPALEHHATHGMARHYAGDHDPQTT